MIFTTDINKSQGTKCASSRGDLFEEWIKLEKAKQVANIDPNFFQKGIDLKSSDDIHGKSDQIEVKTKTNIPN